MNFPDVRLRRLRRTPLLRRMVRETTLTVEIEGVLDEDPSELFTRPCSTYHGDKSLCVAAGCVYNNVHDLCGISVDRPPAASPSS